MVFWTDVNRRKLIPGVKYPEHYVNPDYIGQDVRGQPYLEWYNEWLADYEGRVLPEYKRVVALLIDFNERWD